MVIEKIRQEIPYCFIDIKGRRCVDITVNERLSLSNLRRKTYDLGVIYLNEYKYNPIDNTTVFTLRTINSVLPIA